MLSTKSIKMAFYAVARGRTPGIYNTWAECRDNVSGFSGAAYKKFPTRREAQSFVDHHGSLARPPTPQAATGPGPRVSKPRARSGPPAAAARASAAIGACAPAAEITAGAPAEVSVYVDGASRGNGKERVPRSGYGVFYGAGDARNAAVPLSAVDDVSQVKPTNQRAELHAIHHALRDIARDLERGAAAAAYAIYTDSMYVKNCLDTWAEGWKRHQWHTFRAGAHGRATVGKPVANRDIVERAYDLLQEVRAQVRVDIRHVKGHSGDAGNEAADRLANAGADQM